MMDWDSDPELKAMRAEFVGSFKERREKLEELVRDLGQIEVGTPISAKTFEGIAFVAHKLAGAATSYGFPLLTEVSAALEDWIGMSPASELKTETVIDFSRLLMELLAASERHSEDAKGYEKDPRLEKLLMAATHLRR